MLGREESYCQLPLPWPMQYIGKSSIERLLETKVAELELELEMLGGRSETLIGELIWLEER